jgi:protein-S-isoprenylcysteine O-methyltransferase Ste14
MVLLLKNLLFTLIAPGTTAVLLPLWVARGAGATVDPTRAWLAAPLFAAGLTVYAWTVTNFARLGRGTPAPIDPPRRLIVQGLHRYVRNPMYLGVLLVVLGWAALFASPAVLAYAAVLALTFHLFVLAVEEPSLRSRFGDEYERYCRAVGRWIPGRPYSPG